MILGFFLSLFLAHSSADRGEPLILERADHFTVAGRGAMVDLVGDVRFHRGDVKLRADRATWDRSQDVVTFSGNFRVEHPSGTIHSDIGRYERATGSALASGAARMVDSSGKVTLTAAQVHYSRPDRTAEAVGSPVFRQCNSQDTLEVRGERLLWHEHDRVAEAVGHVTIRKGGMTAKALHARLEDRTHRLQLTGDPEAVMGERRLRGGEILFLVDLKTQKIHEVSVFRHAEGIFDGEVNARGERQRGRLTGDTLHARVTDDRLDDVLAWKDAKGFSWMGEDTLRRDELSGDSLHFSFAGKDLREVRSIHHSEGRFRGDPEKDGTWQCGRLTGDTLIARLEHGSMKSIAVWPKARGFSWKSGDSTQQDELSGDTISFAFKGKHISLARACGVGGTARSLYHHAENGRSKGRNEAHGDLIRVTFAGGRVRRVRIDRRARGTYYGAPRVADAQPSAGK